MGKIKDKLIDIEEHVAMGFSANSIAALLQVPIQWVYDVMEKMDEKFPEEFEG